MPLDAAIPAQGRRHPNPVDEALIARTWGLRQEYERDGYVFPGYPPARKPWWLLPPEEREAARVERRAERLARGEAAPAPQTCVQMYFISR